MKMALALMIVMLGVLAVCPAVCRAADDSEISINKDYTEEIGPESPLPGGSAGPIFHIEHTIALKAGQKVTVAVSVVGSDRTVEIHLQDSTGQMVGKSKKKPGSSTLEVVVSATGVHTIQILSNRIGEYTVHVSSDNEDTEATIQARIDDLKQKLAVEEQKLKELRAKKQAAQ